ncbi:sugar phosphate/phosphate translocator-like protein [Hapsidospora chrysogenum ATCC 11550]|uniref:Sugar phosphate/phosphate translocator-like protein n=1 Tax=Hapsidospora chrysogenum (strain ATCC 11550 / CBS 779.69 / DSM 880 / IAM 14645 / JCM 23072 / IMI 49137) TaxID=857340 RepID=A0A086ST39_HAPC1|nr:sugar phosphate/phosphate translocator-like protein [Hapsidospora chrysogenum ATCC 11550]
MASGPALPLVERPSPPPPPPQASSSRRTQTTVTALYMIAWISSSNCTILFNKWLINNAGFDYPVLLTCWHQLFAAVVTQILARTTTLLDSRRSLQVNSRFYLRTILPIGLASSGAFVCSNLVYRYLSVSFIQMLKASSPVIVLFVSWLWGVAEPTGGTIVNILFIVGGVVLASAGEISFSWIGVIFQMSGLLFEAVRVVMIQVMLSSEGMNMDALVGLYYCAPVGAAFNLAIAAVTEIPRFNWDHLVRTGWVLLLLNATAALMLSVTSMVLIGRTSSLVTTLTGIFKNILLIISSVVIWGTEIAAIQIIGYTMSLGGLVYYAFGYEKLLEGSMVATVWAAGHWDRWTASLPFGKTSALSGALYFNENIDREDEG